mgnify:CR=1 FL=1
MCNFASCIAARISLTPDSTADKETNRAPTELAINLASVVLPVPGGPQNIIDSGIKLCAIMRQRHLRRPTPLMHGFIRPPPRFCLRCLHEVHQLHCHGRLGFANITASAPAVVRAVEDKNALMPLDQAIRSNLSESTTKILATLTPREERVLRMRFGIGMNTDHTLEEVGLQFSVTRERIRQIEAKALRKLKHPSRSKHLKSFLEK